MAKTKQAPDNETGQEKFRRVFNQRWMIAKKYLFMIETMATQPGYEITDVDAQRVLDELNDSLTVFFDKFQRIAKGETYKTKKEPTGIDFNKLYEEEEEASCEGE